MFFWSHPWCFGPLGKFWYNIKISIKTARFSRISFRFLWLCFHCMHLHLFLTMHLFVLAFKICFCIRVLFGYIWSIKDLIFGVKKTKIYHYIIIDHYWPYWSWLFIFLFSFFSNIVWIFQRKSLSLLLYFSLALENVQFACVFFNMACFVNFII